MIKNDLKSLQSRDFPSSTRTLTVTCLLWLTGLLSRTRPQLPTSNLQRDWEVLQNPLYSCRIPALPTTRRADARAQKESGVRLDVLPCTYLGLALDDSALRIAVGCVSVSAHRCSTHITASAASLSTT